MRHLFSVDQANQMKIKKRKKRIKQKAKNKNEVFFCVWCRIRIKANQIKSSKCSKIEKETSLTKIYLHMSANACCRCTCVRWLANCEREEKNISWSNRIVSIPSKWQHRCVQTCWWCASVCFISTIRMLCSMAYFFALATKSCWSDVNFGSAPLKMPSNGDREPGPNSTSPSCRRSFNGALINGIFGCQSENMKIAMFINKPQAQCTYTVFVSVWNKMKTDSSWHHPRLPRLRWLNFSHFGSNSEVTKFR